MAGQSANRAIADGSQLQSNPKFQVAWTPSSLKLLHRTELLPLSAASLPSPHLVLARPGREWPTADDTTNLLTLRPVNNLAAI